MSKLNSLLTGFLTLYLGCTSTNTPSYIPTPVVCVSNADCKSGRICNVAKGVCEWPEGIDAVVEQKDSFVGNDIYVSVDAVVNQDVEESSDVVSVDVVKDELSTIPLSYLKGDVNCDGNINTKDLFLLKSYLTNNDLSSFKLVTPSCDDVSVALNAANLNCDTKTDGTPLVNTKDLFLLQKYLSSNGQGISVNENGCWSVESGIICKPSGDIITMPGEVVGTIDSKDVLALQYVVQAIDTMTNCGTDGLDTCPFSDKNVYVCKNGKAFLQSTQCSDVCQYGDLITMFGEVVGTIDSKDILALQYVVQAIDTMTDCGLSGQGTCDFSDKKVYVCKSGKAYLEPHNSLEKPCD